MENELPRRRVLFLCRENACRSQMAEGFLRAEGGASFDTFSAGAEPSRVNRRAIEVMRELGIDISGQQSKSIRTFDGWSFDFVITVCEGDACPFFAGEVGSRLHWGFEDPAAARGTPDEVLEAFRKVRDEIQEGVRRFIEENGW